MEKTILEATPTTPQIILDPAGRFEFSGKSLPENSFEFYRPVLDWLDDFSSTYKGEFPVTLSFKLEYFNTSSTSHFLKVIKKIERLFQDGYDASVFWFHDPEDEDMREAGEDFRLLVRMPINIVAADIPQMPNE